MSKNLTDNYSIKQLELIKSVFGFANADLSLNGEISKEKESVLDSFENDLQAEINKRKKYEKNQKDEEGQIDYWTIEKLNSPKLKINKLNDNDKDFLSEESA